jgi:hypothetical protein
MCNPFMLLHAILEIDTQLYRSKHLVASLMQDFSIADLCIENCDDREYANNVFTQSQS